MCINLTKTINAYSFLPSPHHAVHPVIPNHIPLPYSIISSLSSSTSSTTSSITLSSVTFSSSVLAFRSSATGSAGRPRISRSSATSCRVSSSHWCHSSSICRRACTTARSADAPRSASSCSKTREYSRSDLRICFCSSLASSVGGRGRHAHCLNFSSGSSRSCSPRKS